MFGKGSILSAALMILGAEAGFKYGGCPKVDIEQNFVIDDYLGDWYEI